MTTPSNHDRATVDQVAEEYLKRKQHGEAPSIEEYESRYPHLAEDIRKLLLMLQSNDESAHEPDSVKSPWTKLLCNEEKPPEFSDYRIVRLIGRGGMGVVYEAIQKSLNRQVALKVLPRDFATQRNAVARFQQEARAAATLHHTNIVPVFEVGFEDGHHFYSMQYIDGAGLDSVIKQISVSRSQQSVGDRRTNESSADAHVKNNHDSHAARPNELPQWGNKANDLDGDETLVSQDDTNRDPASSDDFELHAAGNSVDIVQRLQRQGDPFKAIAKIGQQAASALAHANQQGIIHRDIKPANMLMDQTCRIWIADFGLAQFDEDGLTRTGGVVGTLRYIAPERFDGQCDARSDIYSLGLSLYELVALRPAFHTRNRLSLLEQIRESVPAGLRSINRDVPRDLETIIHKSIDKDPKRRYQNAAEFADDLERYVDDRPIQARKTGPIERLVRWSKKNPALSIALSTIALLMLTGLVALSIGLEHFRQQEIEQRNLAETHREHLYEAEMKNAFEEMSSRNAVKLVRSMLNGWVPKQGEKDLRGWEWYHLDNACRQESVVLETMAQMSVSGISPSHRYLATGSGVFDIIDLDTLQLVHTFLENDLRIFLDVTWKDENEVWAIVDGGIILRFNVNTGERLPDINTTFPIHRLTIQPGQPFFVAHSRDKKHLICDMESGAIIEPLQLNKVGALKQAGLAFDSSGKWLASANEDFTISIYDTQTWEHVHCVATDHQQMIDRITWAPGQQKMVVVDWAGKVSMVEFDESTARSRLIADHGSPIITAAWDEGATRVAYAGQDQLVRVWDEEQAIISRQFYGHSSTVYGVHFCSRNQSLLSVSFDTTIREWSLDKAPAFLKRRYSAQNVRNAFNLFWNPEGYLVTHGTIEGQGEGVYQRWDRHGIGNQIGTLQGTMYWDGADKKVIGHQNADLVWMDSNDLSVLKSCPFPGFNGLGHDYCEQTDTLYFNGSDTSEQIYIFKWNPQENEQPVKVCKTEYQSVLKVDPTGKFFVTNHTGAPGIFDCDTGKLVHRVGGHSGLYAVAWSKDGRFVAIAGNGGDLSIYKTHTWEKVHQLNGHARHVRCMQFHPTENRIASVGDDNYLRIWNTDTGRLVVSFKHESNVMAVAWSPDGKNLATADQAGYVRAWYSE